jgi:hypothetical protein
VLPAAGLEAATPARLPEGFEIVVSAVGLEPTTHALKGLVRPEINDLDEVGDSSTE